MSIKVDHDQGGLYVTRRGDVLFDRTGRSVAVLNSEGLMGLISEDKEFMLRYAPALSSDEIQSELQRVNHQMAAIDEERAVLLAKLERAVQRERMDAEKAKDKRGAK